MQSSQQITRQIQSSHQRLQDKVQASQKRLQESYQSQRDSNNAYSGYAQDVFSYRFSVWCIVQGVGTVIIPIVTPLALPLRVAVKVMLPLLGFFTVTSAVGCYCLDRSPEPSLDKLIVLPEIKDKPEKLPAEGYYDSIRSVFNKVACCASWFISQEKPESKPIMLKIEDKPEKLPAEGYCDSIRSLLGRVACYCSFLLTSQEKSKSKPIVQKIQSVPIGPIKITLKFRETFFDVELLPTFDGKTINPKDRMLQVDKQKQIIEEIIKIHEPDYTDSLGLIRAMTDKGLIFERGILPHGNKARDLWKKLSEKLKL